jgi:hypothetical protein
MKGPDLVGYEPTLVKWSQDSQRVYFHWKRAGEPRLKETDVYVVGVDGSGLRKLSEDEARLAPPATGESRKTSDSLSMRRTEIYISTTMDAVTGAR